MPAQWSPELVRQLAGAFITRLEMVNWLRAQADDFWGDSLDTRWNTLLGGSGIAAALQATSPSRVLLDTGATSGSFSKLSDSPFRHWNTADRLSVIARSKINNTTSVQHFPIGLNDDSINNTVFIEYSTNLGDTGWKLRARSGGVLTTSAVIQAANTDWNIFWLSMQAGSVKARINTSAVVEVTTNIPTVDMELLHQINNLVAASRTTELDYWIIIPGMALF